MLNKFLNGLKDTLKTRDDRRHEDRLYEVIYREIETNNLHPAAKARAMAEGGDNDRLVKQSYIRHRLRMLKDAAAPLGASSHGGGGHKPPERPVRVKPQSFSELSDEQQLQDFMTRMGHVDDVTVGQMLVAAVAELDRMAANSPDTKTWFMDYSPSHDHDLLTLSNALHLRIKAHQSSGEAMLAPPLIIWMHTARGILDANLTGDVVKMWEELGRRGSASLSSTSWSMLEDIDDEFLVRAKHFRPEALFQRFEMLSDTTGQKDFGGASNSDVPSAQTDQVNRITEIILDTLQMQLDLSGAAFKQMPDDYVVGYIAGYCDAVLQKKGVDNNSADGLSVLTITFQSLYGLEIGGQRLRDFLKQQSSMSEHMYAGLQRGGEDVFEWLAPNKDKSRSTGPMGLFQYLTKDSR